MKLMIGFIAGVVVGGYLATNTTEEQRAKASDAASKATQRVQQSTVGRSVAENVSRVTSAASDRTADAVDAAGDTITGAIEPDPAPASTSSSA
jgi:hypothetical protein